MPKFLETKLKARYGKDSAVPYKIMNSIGAMHGNKETVKGREMEKKHTAKLRSENHDYDHRRPKRPVKSRYA